jgi:hypothetical protein
MQSYAFATFKRPTTGAGPAKTVSSTTREVETSEGVTDMRDWVWA